MKSAFQFMLVFWLMAWLVAAPRFRSQALSFLFVMRVSQVLLVAVALTALARMGFATKVDIGPLSQWVGPATLKPGSTDGTGTDARFLDCRWRVP